MILDACYNRSDHQLEFQIQDRIAFRSVLALSLDDTLPEAKTIWPQATTHPGRTEQKTFSVPKGPMVGDGRMVAIPRQPNSREENKSIKNGLNHFGDQMEIDVKHKLIRRDEVRPAWVHDRYVWPELRTENNSRWDGGLTQPQIEANHQPWKTDRRVKPIVGIQQMGRQLDGRKQRPSQGQS